MKLEYYIVRRVDPSELVAEVQRMISEEGWRPLGGVAVDACVYTSRESDGVTTATAYIQAMTLESA